VVLPEMPTPAYQIGTHGSQVAFALDDLEVKLYEAADHGTYRADIRNFWKTTMKNCLHLPPSTAVAEEFAIAAQQLLGKQDSR
jgi:hypothetical protein